MLESKLETQLRRMNMKRGCAACLAKNKRILQLERDMSTLIAKIKALEEASIRDTLTGLFTRKYADTALKALINGGDPGYVMKISALFVDIDHFKSVNDTYGHAVGDSVIKHIASVIRNSVRADDNDVIARTRTQNTRKINDRRSLPVRYAGDEFLIYLCDASESRVDEIAERIRASVAAMQFRIQETLRVTVSIGISTGSSTSSLSALVKRADTAMYAAKRGGGNRVVRFEDLVGKREAA